MTKRKIIENEDYDKSLFDISKWPSVRIESLIEKDQDSFRRRKKAIHMYFENRTHKEIKAETGINRGQFSRLLKKCLQFDDNGVLWGFRALIPYKHIKSYERNFLPKSTDESKVGAFQLLLNTYPSLRDYIDKLILKNNNRDPFSKNIKTNYIHKKFIQKCRELNIKAPNYPFNTEQLGKRSLYSYANNLLTNKSSSNWDENDIISPLIVKRPFERVQFDGHKIDLALALVIKTPEDIEIVRVINRIWILTIMDVATRSILGYHISLNKEYSSTDVLKCLKNAIAPMHHKEFTITGLKYPENGGFPSRIIPETQWAKWDELYLDNAKANLAELVRSKLKYVVGCTMNAGQVKKPLRRVFVERFYGLLEENGFHRLINTTGNSPSDSRRNDAEKMAVKYRITPDHIEEIAEVLIAEYNGTPHEGLSFQTPLEIMNEKIRNNPLVINYISSDSRSEVSFLSLHAQRKINGNLVEKRKPYIEYENVRYTNSILSRSYGLIGEKLDLIVNTDDIRIIRAFLPDGAELGTLKAMGKWGLTPHSLKIRKEIFSLRKRKLIYFTSSEDAIDVYEKYLKNEFKTNKNARNKLGSLNRSISERMNVENNFENVNEENFINNELNNIDLEVNKIARRKINVENSEKKLRKTIFF
jgi:hypothetical protein